jgi:hypothetical protein
MLTYGSVWLCPYIGTEVTRSSSQRMPLQTPPAREREGEGEGERERERESTSKASGLNNNA